jgi:putative membrane protein
VIRLLTPLLWLLRVIVFVILFGLAVKNSGPMELRFYFDTSWQAPISVVVLTSFSIGILVGLTAVVGLLVRRKKPQSGNS